MHRETLESGWQSTHAKVASIVEINLPSGKAFAPRWAGITRRGIYQPENEQTETGNGDSISVFQKQKQLISNTRSWGSLNPRFADVRAMWPTPRWNATLVPGMRCNDRNHLRFSYGGMFLGPVCARSRPRRGIRGT